MAESYSKIYDKNKVFNLFNTWYFGVGLDKYRFIEKDAVFPIQIHKYPNIVYIGFRGRKHLYNLSFRFGKYDKSVSSGG